MSVSLNMVIPVYNEPVNIIKTLDSIENDIHIPLKVFIVYDSEEDTTLPAVADNKQKYGFEIRLLRNKYGRGALNAIKTGLEESDSEGVLVAMADLSDDFSAVDPMVKTMEESGCDMVCGSRYMKGGEHHGGPFFKGLMSRMAGLSLHFLTGIPTHDATNSFKLYSRKLLDTIKIESSGGFELGLELAVKAYCSGMEIREVPSAWYDRDDGESHFKLWSWLPHYLHWYFYCFTHSFGQKK